MRSRILFIILLLTVSVRADEYRSKINEGYDLYKNGEYDKATQQFKDAAILKPEQALPTYDKGTALYKSNDYETAAGEFESSAAKSDPKLKADSYYNAGNSYFKAQKYDQAVKSYIDALKLNPGDKEAKKNLEMALVQKQQQQQQQQKQDQNKKDQNKQDQNKQDQNKQDQNKQDKDKQDQQKQDQQDQQKQDQQQQNQQQKASPQKMKEEQAQQLLERYAEDEKEVQKKLKQVNVRSRSANDW
jgi:Ca-activated chloride channel homolog